MSYVSQQFLVCDNSSLANFKSWAQAISNAFSGAGWAQTTDTGQVNWGTIASVPSSAFVYEMWKPTDALQTGSSQFFVKVEYGFSSTTCRLQLSVGTGTNGSGTLTGTVWGTFTSSFGNQGATFGLECDFSGDTNRMGFILYRSFAAAIMFVIERTHNTDGTDNATGVFIFYATGSSGTNTRTILFSGAGLSSSSSWPFTISAVGTLPAASFNNSISISPVFPEYGVFSNPITGMCAVSNSVVAEGCEFTTTIYGASRTYLYTINVVGKNTGGGFGLRFD